MDEISFDTFPPVYLEKYLVSETDVSSYKAKSESCKKNRFAIHLRLRHKGQKNFGTAVRALTRFAFWTSERNQEKIRKGDTLLLRLQYRHPTGYGIHDTESDLSK